jgi:hypothetical protein
LPPVAPANERDDEGAVHAARKNMASKELKHRTDSVNRLVTFFPLSGISI